MIPLIPVALSLVPSLARWLIGDKAGQVADQVAGVVASVTGTSDPVQAQLAMSDPAKAAELQIALARIIAEQEAAALADVANARAQTVALAQAGSSISWAAPVISVVIVAGFFFCIALMFIVERTWDERTAGLIQVLFGALISGFVQVCNYWLGSSAGSKRAGDAVRAIAVNKEATS